MCLAGLQGAACSRQVHQLTQGTGKINNNILLSNERKKQRKNNSGKSQERESLSVSRKSLH